MCNGLNVRDRPIVVLQFDPTQKPRDCTMVAGRHLIARAVGEHDGERKKLTRFEPGNDSATMFVMGSGMRQTWQRIHAFSSRSMPLFLVRVKSLLCPGTVRPRLVFKSAELALLH